MAAPSTSPMTQERRPGKQVTAFITRSAEVPDPRVFERFGLPSRLD